MSKTKPKDKKGQVSSLIQQQFQQQKREILDYQFSVKKLHQRLADLTQQNIYLKKERQEKLQLYNEMVEQITIKNQTNQKRVLTLSNDKTKLQIQNSQKDNKIKMLQKNLFDEQLSRNKEIEQYKKNFHFQLAKYESQLTQYKLYMNEREELDHQRTQLRQKIQIQKANKLREIADKQRQKVQATDKLKDEMLHKINQMRKNLFSLKRQQLSTTTRLTMLQNHQLTSQLEYQSKQTQKLIFKNDDLQKKIVSLKQELDIHKQVQDQLAKRSHFSKGVIKKLNIRVNQLEGQVQQLKNTLCLPGNSHQQTKGQSEKANAQVLLQLQKNKKILKTLDLQLEKSEKRYAELLGQLSIANKDKETYRTKLNLIQQKSNKIYQIISKFYDQQFLKENKINQIDNFKENNYQCDFQRLNHTKVQEWSQEDLKFVVEILLNIIQPYLNKKNIFVPTIRKNVVLLNSKRQETIQKSLPKLSTQRNSGNIQKMPICISSKIVGSNLRQWGQTVKLNKMGLKRKYKLSQSFRG